MSAAALPELARLGFGGLVRTAKGPSEAASASAATDVTVNSAGSHGT
jgi:hypothetical protein